MSPPHTPSQHYDKIFAPQNPWRVGFVPFFITLLLSEFTIPRTRPEINTSPREPFLPPFGAAFETTPHFVNCCPPPGSSLQIREHPPLTWRWMSSFDTYSPLPARSVSPSSPEQVPLILFGGSSVQSIILTIRLLLYDSFQL